MAAAAFNFNTSMISFLQEVTKPVTDRTHDAENTTTDATISCCNSTKQTNESSDFVAWLQGYILNNIFYYSVFTICTVGAINNIIVMITMLMSKKLLKNSGGMLIMALAFVDCSLNISVWIDWYDFYHHVVKNFVYCVAYTYYWHITRSLTHLIIMLIGINRYALVCHPFTHRRITSRKSALFQLLGVVAFASIGSIYIFYSNDPDADFCTLNLKTIHIYFIGFNIVDSVLSNIVPLGVTIVLTTKILLALKKKSNYWTWEKKHLKAKHLKIGG